MRVRLRVRNNIFKVINQHRTVKMTSAMKKPEERKLDTDQLKLREHSALASTNEGRFVIDQFYDNIPDPRNIKEWYAGFTPEGYNEWARVVNFTEP